jgi:glutamate-1-semialdehyde 2,1-aminomutase
MAAESLDTAYRRVTPGSAALAERARRVLPDGISTDTRNFDPYGIYVERAAGVRKWDVDGNEYVDFFGGHGALMLGHCPAPVTEAVQKAVANGIQFATNHRGEVEWAETVIRHVPSAELVRFAGSGTEATLLALRIARARTGQPKILRIATHYHGWHDAAAVGYDYSGATPAGLPQAVTDNIVLVKPNDVDGLRQAIVAHRGSLAALIIEPLGSHFGIVPTSDRFVEAAYELARANGLLVIFDEVITGFRVHPGGMQAVLGLKPDLTCLAKVAAGGMPGGLVCGSRDIMSVLCQSSTSGEPNKQKFLHQGTFTGNPVTAAAATATISAIVDGGLCDKVNALGEIARQRIGELFRRLGLAWHVYGRYSSFHILPMNGTDDVPPGPVEDWPTALIMARRAAVLRHLRIALNLEGIDIAARGTAFLSAAHDETHLDALVQGLESAIKRLRTEQLI